MVGVVVYHSSIIISDKVILMITKDVQTTNANNNTIRT